MAKNKKNIGGNYNNHNGEMSIKDMIKLKHDNKVEEFLINFRVTKHPCPNSKLKPKNARCFYCISDCWIPALDKIKEYKNYYKVLGKKYPKEEFNEN